MKTLILLLSLLPFSALSDPGGMLTLYVAPPERQLDWSSPRSLFQSLFTSRLFMTKRPFGSAVAELRCWEDENKIGPGSYFSTEAESFDLLGPVVFQGRGLGFLYSSHPGRFLSSEEARQKMLGLLKIPGANLISYLIGQKHCARITSFVAEFKKHNVARNFGLPHRPLMAEGSTDVSFVVALLEVAGLLDQEQRESWERALYLPRERAGAPLTDRFIFFTSLLTDSWGNMTDDSIPLRFWDAERIADWELKRKIREVNDIMSGKLPAGTRGGEPIDRKNAPVPQGTPWEQANDPSYKKK